MVDIVLNSLENLASETSACQAINENFESLKAAVEAALSRLGQTSNQMEVDLDMNGNNLTNLSAPTSGSDAARWIDVYAGLTLTDYAVPNLTGNIGKFLTTADGLTLTWASGATGTLVSSANLSDVTNVPASRSNLGLGTAAVADSGNSGHSLSFLDGTNAWSGTQSFLALTPFTGGTTFGGTGDYRLTNAPTSLASDSIGFRGAPQVVADFPYTFVLDSAGRGYSHTSGTAHAWTIPPDASVAFPVHTIILLDNSGTGVVTITRGAGVNLRVNGSATNADVALNQNFVKSIYKEAANRWVVL